MTLSNGSKAAFALVTMLACGPLAANAEPKLIVQNTDAAACAYLQSIMSVASACQQNILAIASGLDARVTAVRFVVEYQDKSGETVHEVTTVTREKDAVLYFRAVDGITGLRIRAVPLSVASSTLTYP